MTRPTVLAWGVNSCVDIKLVEKTLCGRPRCLPVLLCLPLSGKGESRGFGLRMAKCPRPAPGLASSGERFAGTSGWWAAEPLVLQPGPWGPV